MTRTYLGDEIFVRAFAEGRTMTSDQILSLQEPVVIIPPLGSKQSLAPSVKRSPNYPAGLTAREVEVLRLVAQGLTDA
jgi:DNA-binding NarL/FixJ family response regulator